MLMETCQKYFFISYLNQNAYNDINERVGFNKFSLVSSKNKNDERSTEVNYKQHKATI